MNLLQKNPRDPKHREFHDGEYEYWPAKAPSSGKSISIPAATVNGLNALAAMAAAALLAAALTVLYTQSSPRAIHKEYAVINVNIYNNVDDLEIRYSLYRFFDQDTLLQQEELEQSQETLNLRNLSPGTRYILYYDAYSEDGWENIGEFEFVTPGDPVEGDLPLPPVPTEPVSAPEPTAQTESTEPAAEETEPAEETTLPEETTEETIPPNIWYPPVRDPDPTPTPEPTPEPTTEQTTEPSTEPTTEPATEPTTEPTTEPSPKPEPAAEPEISNVTFHESLDSGDENDGYYSFQQIHKFQDIPEGDYEVEIRQNGQAIREYTASISDDGILSITFTGNQVAVGAASTTSVTVTWEDGTQAVSTQTQVMPSMKDVQLAVTKNADNTHTFTVTVTADPSSEYTLAFDTLLYLTWEDGTGVSVEMNKTASDTYTGTHTASITTTEPEEEATVYVSAIWDMAGNPAEIASPQNGSAYILYTP